jgi:hypothetical protein
VSAKPKHEIQVYALECICGAALMVTWSASGNSGLDAVLDRWTEVHYSPFGVVQRDGHGPAPRKFEKWSRVKK